MFLRVLPLLLLSILAMFLMAAEDSCSSTKDGETPAAGLTPGSGDTPAAEEPGETLVPPEPVTLQGSGQTATEAVTPPSAISVVALTHNGSSNFIVNAFQGGQETLLVNEIGPYQGTRPLVGDGDVTFDVDADGAWTIVLSPLGTADGAAFSGTGAAVSGLFDPPDAGAWEFTHDGQANFVVWAHCAGGDNLVQNEIGAVSGSGVVDFGDGPCFWEVDADGSWTLAPR